MPCLGFRPARRNSARRSCRRRRPACARHRRSAAPPRLFDEPPLGQCVVLRGLSSRPDLNGQRGVVWSFEGGRYTVAVEGGGETVRVRPANLSAEPEGAASTSAPMLRARTIAARPANAPHGAPKKLVAGGASSAAGGDAARQSSRRERDGARVGRRRTAVRGGRGGTASRWTS